MNATKKASVDAISSFVVEHGIVLVSAKGPVPRLVDVIAGESIKGSWWAHPKGREIFAVLSQVVESSDVLVCRLINGKVTLVHRRLWPALVRLSKCFQPEQLAQVHEEHTPSGRHVNHEISYPKWVPKQVVQEAKGLSEEEARGAFGALLDKIATPPGAKRRPGGRNVS